MLFLNSFEYQTPSSDSRKQYKISELWFDKLSLVVGKNATGKSQILTLIDSFADMILQAIDLKNGTWNFGFKLNGENLVYEIRIQGDFVLHEKLFSEKTTYIERDEDSAKIFDSVLDSHQEIFPPKQKLVLQTRRDTKHYPIFEEIFHWAKNIYHIKFGHIYANKKIAGIAAKSQSQLQLSAIFHNLSDKAKVKLIKSIEKLHLDIDEIGIGSHKNDECLYVREKSTQFIFHEPEISESLYRLLTFMIFLLYLQNHNSGSLLLIDDFCEGLDYESTKNIGNFLLDNFDESNTQLIISSNSHFLMDLIDIRHWNILHRQPLHIQAINFHNKKNEFEDFKFTGLSNSDLLTSDYLSQSSRDEESGESKVY